MSVTQSLSFSGVMAPCFHEKLCCVHGIKKEMGSELNVNTSLYILANEALIIDFETEKA